MSSPLRRSAVLAATALAGLLLAACASGASDSTAAGSADRAVSNDAAGSSGGAKSLAGEGSSGSAAPKPGSTPGTSGDSAGVTRANLRAAKQQLARRATVALEVSNINQAVAKVRSTTLASRGLVLAENIGVGGGGVPLAERDKVTATTYGEITISVPSDKLDAVVAELGSIGKVIRSSTSSEDVGGQIVDTQSRLATMRVSVERVRALLKDAKDLNQVVSLEAELTRRQSDLEALEAQLASLEDSVAMSPVQVSLTTRPEVIGSGKHDDAGFLAGLRDGWDAFTSSATVLLTVLGAVLPFAALLVVLGVPLLLWLRRRRALAPAPTVLPQ